MQTLALKTGISSSFLHGTSSVLETGNLGSRLESTIHDLAYLGETSIPL